MFKHKNYQCIVLDSFFFTSRPFDREQNIVPVLYLRWKKDPVPGDSIPTEGPS